jgi:hypothetical protein
VLVAAVLLYGRLDYSWLVFALLFLFPDMAIIAYAINKNVGVHIYNILHTTLSPFILLGLSVFFEWPFGIQLALIWFAHIGMDRIFGYGLKYAGQFKETHLQRV